MLPYLELFGHMASLRGLLLLAAHMEERGDRVTLIAPQAITLVGDDMTVSPDIVTSKGATVTAADAYALMQQLKGHEAPEYAVTREELKALNARAVADIEAGPALAAFGETLARLGLSTGNATTATTPTQAVTPPSEASTTDRQNSQNTDRQNKGRKAEANAKAESKADAKVEEQTAGASGPIAAAS